MTIVPGPYDVDDWRNARNEAWCAASLVALTLPWSASFAQESATTAPKEEEIVVYGRAIAQVGSASTGSEGVVGYEDFEHRPLVRVGELAENVPGLIATQHSGEGKANQYFLRGFNLDHGTDLSGFVDGAPINMRTHGHGQGYLDLNFLIPEMVERIDYKKGPYHAALGDFSSAGSMAYTTRSALTEPIAEVTAGSWGYWRALAARSTDVGQRTVLAAVEGTVSNGPWVLDQKLRKLNGFIKYSASNWSLSLSAYDSRWNSTDQVPERAIATGRISRFGHIDPDLGGQSSRVAFTFNGLFGDTRASAYLIGSRFRLVSNFTYFLDDPVDGDQFEQVDQRGVFGGSVAHEGRTELAGHAIVWRVGAETRFDRIGKVGLYRSIAGMRTAPVREDRVDQYSGGLYGEMEAALALDLRLILGLRGDVIGYRVRSDLVANSGSGLDAILTPKAALAWKAAEGLEFYANYGEGYHSNDVRGATITVDPASGQPTTSVPVFVRSRGVELGVRTEQASLTASLVGFWLGLDSELVFVGDAGTTEPNAASERFGAELALFWRPTNWLTLDGSAAVTSARFRGVLNSEDRIPNAVPIVLAAGANAKIGSALTGTVRLRHFGSAPLIENNAQRSDPTTLVNAGVYWTSESIQLGVDLLNLFDAETADIIYFYTSRLTGEAEQGAEDRHIHPVEPRQVRISLRYRF